jgi:hypothetical protein
MLLDLTARWAAYSPSLPRCSWATLADATLLNR